MREKTIHLPINSGSEADLRHIDEERSSTDEERPGKRNCQKKTSGGKFFGGQSKPKVEQ